MPSVLNLYLPTDLQLKVKRIASFPSHKLIFRWSMGQISLEYIKLNRQKQKGEEKKRKKKTPSISVPVFHDFPAEFIWEK